METPQIRIKCLFPDTQVPVRAEPTASGLDLFAYSFDKVFDGAQVTEEGLILIPGSRALINTGISATVGVGYEIQVRPRSGLALKNGLTVLNTPGTIDEAYRGTIGVILINLSKTDQFLKKGDRIAQMVVCPVCISEVVVVEDLGDTVRGAGGFGSSGV